MTDFPTTYDMSGKEIQPGRRVLILSSIEGRFDMGTIVDVIEADVGVTDDGKEWPQEHQFVVRFGEEDEVTYQAVLEDGNYVVKEFEVL